MLNAVLATIATVLWVGSYGLYFLQDIRELWYLRHYHRAMSEIERLQAVRAYAAWVRNMPPAPPRRSPGPAIVPMPVIPPVGGRTVPFPGRTLIGD